MHRVLGVQVAPENRRNILADLLTVYANAGKTIVFERDFSIWRMDTEGL